jgi:hypothetical protein
MYTLSCGEYDVGVLGEVEERRGCAGWWDVAVGGVAHRVSALVVTNLGGEVWLVLGPKWRQVVHLRGTAVDLFESFVFLVSHMYLYLGNDELRLATNYPLC